VTIIHKINKIKPNFLVIINLFPETSTTKATTVLNKIITEYKIPPEYILTNELVSIITVDINQGKAKQTRISNILLPIELEIAMSPLPFLVTIMPETISGRLVPIASTVRPATVSGIPHVYA
jgi:hypothetical protein